MFTDNDSPPILGGISPQGYLQSYVKGFNDYSQAGTDIKPLRVQNKYGQEQGGPLFDESLISASPSFDLRFPKMPGMGANEQSIEGIPNATPEMIRRYMDRKIRNTGGQELPGFLKGV